MNFPHFLSISPAQSSVNQLESHYFSKSFCTVVLHVAKFILSTSALSMGPHTHYSLDLCLSLFLCLFSQNLEISYHFYAEDSRVYSNHHNHKNLTFCEQPENFIRPKGKSIFYPPSMVSSLRFSTTSFHKNKLTNSCCLSLSLSHLDPFSLRAFL